MTRGKSRSSWRSCSAHIQTQIVKVRISIRTIDAHQPEAVARRLKPMLATLIYGERDIRLEEVPDPQLSTGIDAIVRVVAACVCGSDLWPYRGVVPTNDPKRIGHEFVGIVESIGDDVNKIRVGDFVI